MVHRQCPASLISPNMSLDQALAALLDLLAAADEGGFCWGPEELRAACQWAHTLQQLVDTSAGAAEVGHRLQALRPQLPPSLQASLVAVATQPLRALLERLLRRRPTGQEAEHWLEAVLAAYVTVVLLPSHLNPAAAAAAEQHLLAALGGLQQVSAAQGLLQVAAQQAAASVAGHLRLGSHADVTAAEKHSLLAEALQHMTSPACLEAVAAAQLLAQRARQLAALPPAGQPHEQGPQAAALEGLLHSPPTQLELELLCYMALLPSWEAMLARLAGMAASTAQHCGGSSKSCDYSSGDPSLQQQAVQQLCAACRERPEAVLLSLHPALLAEVCRVSFRFAVAYAPVLAAHLAAAVDDTRSVAAAARWRAAHATKHADHVSDYLQAKLARLPGVEAGSGADPAPVLVLM